jgi:hypothetical protein
MESLSLIAFTKRRPADSYSLGADTPLFMAFMEAVF